MKQIVGSNNLQNLSVNSDLKISTSSVVNAPIEIRKKNEEEKED